MNQCISRKSSCKCASGDHQDPRDWENDPLRQNYNLSLKELKKRLTKEACEVSLNDTVYVYVVATTRVVCQNSCRYEIEIKQEGCAPNFEGGVITLTSCKHRMRCSNNLRELLNKSKLWIAGVTTKEKDKNPLQRNFLFYLMKVDSSISSISFYDFWDIFSQIPNVRKAKNASNNPLGDMYKPLNCNFNVENNKWYPNCYNLPVRTHVHYHCCNGIYMQNPSCWRNCKYGCWVRDISYVENNGSRPLLLVGENPFIGKKKGKNSFNSYLWTKPEIEFVCNIDRGFQKMSLKDFLYVLR